MPCRRGLAPAPTAAQASDDVTVVCALDTKRKAKAADLFAQLRSKSDAQQSRGSVGQPATGLQSGHPVALSKRKAADHDTVRLGCQNSTEAICVVPTELGAAEGAPCARQLDLS